MHYKKRRWDTGHTLKHQKRLTIWCGLSLKGRSPRVTNSPAAIAPPNLLGQATGSLRGVEDLEVKHREVEGQSEPDGVGGGHVLVRQRGRALIGLESLVRRPRPDIALLELREVAVVVPLHLVVENLAGGVGGGGGLLPRKAVPRPRENRFGDENMSAASFFAEPANQLTKEPANR